jgi:hypothetical protein
MEQQGRQDLQDPPVFQEHQEHQELVDPLGLRGLKVHLAHQDQQEHQVHRDQQEHPVHQEKHMEQQVHRVKPMGLLELMAHQGHQGLMVQQDLLAVQDLQVHLGLLEHQDLQDQQVLQDQQEHLELLRITHIVWLLKAQRIK